MERVRESKRERERDREREKRERKRESSKREREREEKHGVVVFAVEGLHSRRFPQGRHGTSGGFPDQLSEFMNSWLHEAFMSFVRGQFALSEISRSPG